MGHQLTPLNIQASRENINEKAAFRLAGKPDPNNLHTYEKFARRSMFGGPVISGRAAMFYVDQMLLKSFTMGSFYGGRLLLRAIEPFRPGDTVTFQGELTSLSEITTTDAGGSQQLVEYRTRSINQREDLVNLSEAALVLKGLAADK